MAVQLVRRRDDLRALVAGWKADGLKVGVVPTMGALHEGHLSLVRTALGQTGRVIVTLFVNPKQFNNAEDLAKYPRTEKADAEKLDPLGAHVLYEPDAEEIYPDGFSTTVSVGSLGEELCGAFRPGHFDGVATVVAKLFLQTMADVAFFGEKDFQQLHVVRRMARDLDIPVSIVGCPTVREADGLALSSRNVRLDASARAAAAGVPKVLFDTAARLSAGELPARVLEAARHGLVGLPTAELEYLELRAEADLRPLDDPSEPARLLVAIWLGGVRLIDNVPVPARPAA